MKRFFFTSLILLSVSVIRAQVTISEASGWLESVFVKWRPVEGVTGYNVYYSGGGVVDRKIDTQLIRNYGTFYRADILGLAAGNYTVKIVPVTGGTEGIPAVAGNLTVLAHDRNGFAFDSGRIPGAYKSDGTPKDGAVIFYITENTKNTVSYNIVTSSKGAVTNYTGFQNILYGIKKGYDPRPFIFRLIGNITDMTVMEGGDIVIENANNATSYVTLEGVGNDAVANGWGVRLKSASNIEVRNIGFMNCNSTAGDDVGLQDKNDHIWVHNCDLFYGASGGDADQIKGDGALDNKGSTYITFSYNHFWDNGKASLLGLSEDTTIGLYITYHHNWFDHSDSRHPRVRFYSAHVYNNYYDGNAKYGVGATMGSSVFVEGNYFRNCKRPMMISLQGTDIASGVANATFSGEAGGIIKAWNNRFDTDIVTNNMTFIPWSVNNTSFDAYAVTDRTAKVPVDGTVVSLSGGNKYNNFDTDAAFYVKNLVVDDPEVAKTRVVQYAGRVEGGDKKFTFNNAVDDISYDVNNAIRTALTNYTTSLVFVQGETVVAVSSQTLTTSTDNNQNVVSGTAIEPMVFTWGGDATDVNVTGLPASGISFAKDVNSKTLIVSGTPTANVSFSVATTGIVGTPVVLSGAIVVSDGSVPSNEVIHNFTQSGKTSTFFTITGNMNSTSGNVSYSGLSLTSRLKIESTTLISFSTTRQAVLTLVFDATFNGSIKVDNISYTAVAGIATVSIAPGSHTITKGDVANLFYIKVVYSVTNAVKNPTQTEVKIYPNPVQSSLNVSANAAINKVEVYTLTGALLKSYELKTSINVAELPCGNYLVKLYTGEDVVVRKFQKY